MGISGLLPLLKPIQQQKHLSEYAGETIAVDAYVWLHRGTYACSPELATGKRTNKYVDYAMHRVRLLKHHKILPYIVFDGGPLPAKKGTESDRKKRREENLARANSLAAQGKHSQAREYYVKCIDVTPQMAYQFIKALKAESIPYVVAPYEADAQMAYLERIGMVDGILTEDSDLLVFGCKKVLFKLDATQSTVTSISRVDFASLGSTTNGGFSLLGWSDVQFRAMAILSGCDYLPSIPGVGLKTAWTLLKKHKIVENVIRALRIEGKKNVPQGYLEAFLLAEQVFLHQRVYDPTQERLVNLTDLPVDIEWDEDKEKHVGGYIEPSLAKQIAEGDVCPISLLPMEDINPTFVPRALKPITMNYASSSNCDMKGKGKERAQLSEKANKTGSILHFFSPKPNVDTPTKSHSQPSLTGSSSKAENKRIIAGRASGKRTLAELMDQDIAAKRTKQADNDQPKTPAHPRSLINSSRFFTGSSSSSSKPQSQRRPTRTVSESTSLNSIIYVADSSRPGSPVEKENVRDMSDEEDIIELSSEEEEVLSPVTQEDGYISPSPFGHARWDTTPELSSPVRSGTTSSSKPSREESFDDDFDADVLSSPPAIGSYRTPTFVGKTRRNTRVQVPMIGRGNPRTTGRVLVLGTPSRSEHDGDDHIEQSNVSGFGPDLRDCFDDWENVGSEIDEVEEEGESMESTASSRGPVTPEDSRVLREEIADLGDEIIMDELEDDEAEIQIKGVTARNAKVAKAWWDRWARDGEARAANGYPKARLPRRRETTITPEGRHKPHVPYSSSSQSGQRDDLHPRKSNYERPDSLSSDGVEEIFTSGIKKLAEFRYLAS